MTRFEGGGYTGTGPRAGGLDGRGGFMAMVHPDETVIDHRAAMGRYSGGGNSPSNGGGPVVVNYNGPTLTFNQQDYLPVSEVPAIIDAAAKRGAEGGHSKSMRTLQNSRSQRAKLGL